MTEMVQGGEVIAFDEGKREITMRVVPWGKEAETARGVESLQKGAFEGIDPGRFVLRPFHEDPPVGRGIRLEETDDWLEMDFRVAKTSHGDDTLALVRDGVTTGVSVEFEDGQVERTKGADGRTRFVHKRVKEDGQLGVATTYKPAFKEAAVLQVRERVEVTEQDAPAAASPAVTTFGGVTADDLQEMENRLIGKVEGLQDKLAAFAAGEPLKVDDSKAQMQRKVQLQIRELADVITTGNEGVVPDATVNTMLGRISTGRPFLNNTRQLSAPPAGTTLLLPKITQRPIVGLQESEKDELASQATIIGTVDFPMLTVGGAADISMQLLKRSSPEFRALWLDLLGDAYATDTENRAIDALLAEAAVVEGGAFDVEAPAFGGAFTNAATATGRTMQPDRIFLSTAAIAKFMDATEPAGGGGRPLYPGIASIQGLTGGPSLPGAINLVPVWTPELDDETPDIIVGPSQAFAWAEDGTYTLEADVPSKFGRDIGLAGMIWYAPLYPAAFTSYTLAA